jgi:methylated-DNA-[protein]-cysteine S-methyltransferase
MDRTDTPIGELLIVADLEGCLRAVHWTDDETSLMRSLRRRHGSGVVLQAGRDPSGLTSAISAYFRGDLEIIDSLPVATGGTEFQRAVWTALRSIRCGTTLSYSDLARRIGRPSAVRAVGLANGANPIAVVVPCHRVIGRDGQLTGYGGGTHRKRWLLAHESARGGSLAALMP